MEKVLVDLGAASYEIFIGENVLSNVGEFVAQKNFTRKALIVTQEKIFDAHGKALIDGLNAQNISCDVAFIPDGETSKNLREAEKLFTRAIEFGLDRKSVVIAFGGGVVGDLAGFVAATYLRGVALIQIPTTLLAQVDSSIGGKTAVDLAGAKNIVGAFWQPRAVCIDPDTLSTLPARQLASGMAEAVKSALIGDAALFERFEAGTETIEEVIAASLAVKKAVVESDEREGGARKSRNFGHSIGHAIEAVTGLPHGQCVALGMLPMCSDAVRARLLPVLERLGLPTQVQADPEAVYAELLHDKKMGDGGITAVFVETPGQCALRQVPPEALRAGIEMVVKA